MSWQQLSYSIWILLNFFKNSLNWSPLLYTVRRCSFFMKARPCCCPCWEEGAALSVLLRCGASPSRRSRQRSQRPWRSVSADHPFGNFCSSILKSCSWNFWLIGFFSSCHILLFYNLGSGKHRHKIRDSPYTCSHSKKICLLFASSQCSLAFRVINLYIF